MSHNFRGYRAEYDEEMRKFSPIIHAVTTQGAFQRLTHDGLVYHASGKIPGVLDEGVVEMLFSVPAGVEVNPHLHNVVLNFGRGDVDIVAFENTIVSANGSALPVLNLNRNSAKVPLLELYSGPTVTDDGDLIYSAWAPPTAAGIGQTATGVVGTEQGEEWILAPGVDYLFRLTNNSGATIDMGYKVSFYEPLYDD